MNRSNPDSVGAGYKATGRAKHYVERLPSLSELRQSLRDTS